MHSPILTQYPKMKSAFFNNADLSSTSANQGSMNHPRSQVGSDSGSNSSLSATPVHQVSKHSNTPRSAGNGGGGSSNGAGSGDRGQNAFDFTELKNQLPPNTGPPGTVSTNNGSANSKNLSHVPCKFFKQGVCQAGNSCPFSHNLEGSAGADKLPCKYFQKGNCKFGLKCALAHFLPDGTRINSKAMQGFRKNSNNNNSNSNAPINNSNNLNNHHNNHHNNNHINGTNIGTDSSSVVSGSFGSNNGSYVAVGSIGTGPNPPSYVTSPPSGLPGSHNQVNDFFQSGGRNSFSSQPIDIGSSVGDLTPPAGTKIARYINFPPAPQQLQLQQHSVQDLQHPPAQQQQQQQQQQVQYPLFTNQFHPQQQQQYVSHPLSPRQGSFGSQDQYSNNSSNGLFTPVNGSNNGYGGILKTPMTRSYSFNTSPPSASANNYYMAFSSPSVQSPPGTTSSSYHVSQQPFSKLGTSNSSFSSTSNYLNSNVTDSAIVDDEDDISSKITFMGGAADDLFREEDFIPASLGDEILSKQELQSRVSRSQSGTLLVKPNFRDLLREEMKEEHEDEEGSAVDDIPRRISVQSPRAEKANLVHEDVFLME